MKAQKRKFSSVTAYSLLSILFGSSLLLTAFSVFLPILFFFKGESMPTWFDLKVGLNPIVNDTILKTSQAENGFAINGIAGSLTIFHPTILVSILSNLIPLLIWGSISYGGYLLRKIIKNVYNGNHFAVDNVRNTRIIAFFVILVPHIVTILQNMVLSTLPQKLIINGMEVHRMVSTPIQIFNFAILPQVLLAGLILFVFAEIFKEGEIIKQENDLTV